MSPLAWLSAAKVYLVGGLIVVLASATAVQTVRLAGAGKTLSDERAAAAQLESDRNHLALTDALRSFEKMVVHSAAQQGLSHALAQETAARFAAERRNGQLAAGLRDAFAAVAARDREEAAAHAAGSGDPGDRPVAVDTLFGEAGELLARSADLQEEARSIVTRRDSEVKALRAQVAADRELLEP